MTAVPVLHRLRTLAIVAVISGGSASAAEQTSASGDDTGEDDGSDEGGSSATPDPCSLVAPADLQAAWGVEFNEGDASETTPPFTFHSCAPYRLSEAQLILVGVRIAESLSQVGDPVAERTRRAVLFSLARLAQVR